MRRFATVPLLLVVAACAEWPDIPASATAETSGWPVLLPLEDVGGPPDDPDREAATETLLNRAESLRNRATVLRQPIQDDDAMERLRQSLGL